MSHTIGAINLITLDIIYSDINRLPDLGEEISTNCLTLSLGGGPVAALVTAARLGADVRLATSLSTDTFSRIAHSLLDKEAIPYRSFDTNLQLGTSPVNVTSVMTIPGKDRSFVSYFPDTDFYQDPSDDLFTYLKDCAYCIASSPNEELFRRLQAQGCRIIYDVGWDDGLCIDALKDTLSTVYLFAPNEKEALKLTGAADPRSALLQLSNYVEQPIVKLGKNGALLYRNGEIIHVPPFKFSSKDTTGAGDAFLGGVTYGLLQGWDILRCVELGNYTGGKAVTGIGCLSSSGSIQEFESLCPKT